jgi:hypothetical protein
MAPEIGAERAQSSASDDDEMATGRGASAVEPVLPPSFGRCGISRVAELIGAARDRPVDHPVVIESGR